MATPDTPTFPIRPANRPALDRVRYRLGAYPDILDAMLRDLDAAPELVRWTHRASDDPGIALLESAAIVADILTFYQEHYANEAFLRTARWRESVQELVRLTGYRLTPALGGRARFAIEVKGTDPVTVPADFPIRADLADVADPVDFLTSDEHTAYPQLGKFRLYREREIASGLTAATASLEIHAVGGSEDPDALSGLDLKKGDRLMIVSGDPTWITTGSVPTTDAEEQQTAQIVKIAAVTPLLGRVVVEIEGSIDEDWSGAVTAYRVNRVFRHFGHNTPPMTTYQSGSGASMTTLQTAAHADRHLKSTCQGTPSHLYTALPKNIIPLDQEVNDLSVGGGIVVEAVLEPTTASSTLHPVTLVRTIRGSSSVTMSWGNVSGPSTWIDLGADGQLVPNPSFSTELTASVRQFRVHEITSQALSLRDSSSSPTGDLTANDQLYHYATPADAETLVGRRIYLQADDGRFAHATVADVDTADPAYARMRRVTLDQTPAGFQHEDFDEAEPTTAVYGNIVDVTQGKAQSAVALGNGDARQTFQTFKLPKSPITYLLVPEATPSHVPELTIRVDGREWTQVDSFHGHGPLEEIYIVRDDADGCSYVQFGDGETGARLPSGVKNVVAECRTGTGALGAAKSGSKPSAGARLDNLSQLALAGEVSEGASAEDEENARLAAPAKLQSLGRLVSLGDYEAEALQIGGVVAASAAWAMLDGVPTIQLGVLLEQARQSDEQFNAVEAVLRAAAASRGSGRHPIAVTQCELRYVYLSVTYACDPSLLQADVDAALRAALGLADDEDHERTGLFGLRRRRLGEKEYLTRIEGTLQNVAGITWCRVDAFGLLDPADDPATLAVPASPGKDAEAPCAATELLQLHPLHLTLTPST